MSDSDRDPDPAPAPPSTVERPRRAVAAGVFAALAVVCFALAPAIGRGMFHTLQDRILGVNAHGLVLKYARSFLEYRDVMKRVAGVRGVAGVAPFTIDEVSLSHGAEGVSRVLLKGVDPELGLGEAASGTSPWPDELRGRRRTLDMARHVTKGSLAGLRRPGVGPAAPEPERPLELALPDPLAPPPPGPASYAPAPALACDTPAELPGVALGVGLARKLGVDIGACVTAELAPDPLLAAREGKRAFRVVGLFETDFEQYDSHLAYADVFETQPLYHAGDSVTGIELTVVDPPEARAVVHALELELADPAYRTMDWEELNHGVFTAVPETTMPHQTAFVIAGAVSALVALVLLVWTVARGPHPASFARRLRRGVTTSAAGAVAGAAFVGPACALVVALRLPVDAEAYLLLHLPLRPALADVALVAALACVAGACVSACAALLVGAVRRRAVSSAA